ncbi:MAG: hypothetical protein GAK45_01299 [Pseudomonas citronellolis]|nr:MAG: hypothetical protein GAK45_01299 [Pseudomonas citronellolis]
MNCSNSAPATPKKAARAELARQDVELVLNERLFGRTLPEVVVSLLKNAWSQVLLLTCLKHGTQSVEWQNALLTMDDLIWSVESHEDLASRQRLLEIVPQLLKSLRDGLASAAFDPFSTSEFFGQLENLHVQAFQRFRQAEERARLQQQAAELEDEDLPLLDEPLDEPAEAVAAMVEVVEEIVLVSPEASPVVEPEDVLADDDPALRQVDALRVGSWVEIQEDDEHKLRCKLAAVIKPSGRYIFVNRTGMKVLEKTRMGLAVEFRRHAVRLLDDALLFDRALESVIGNLRRLKNA